LNTSLARAGIDSPRDNLPKLDKLDVAKKDLSDEQGRSMVWGIACFSAMTNITEINFARTDVGNLTAIALAQLLRCSQNLTTLDLHDNAVKDEGGTALAQALRFNTSLTALRISENRLTETSAKAFGATLRLNSSLLMLTLDKGPIPVQQIKGLVQPVSHVLDLSAAGMGHLSTVVISDLVLDHQESVGVLLLDRNNIEPAGAAVLAEMLQSNNVLQELHLRFSGLKPEGVKSIAAALQKNSCLEKLYLIANNLGSDGAQALVDMLKVNQTINVLDVTDNRLSEEAKAALVAVGKSREGLQVAV